MSNVYFIGDLHLGHKNISKFSGDLRIKFTKDNVRIHDEWIVEQWNKVIGHKDKVFVVGDVAMTPQALQYMERMKGQKHLILGNHDKCDISLYQKYFQWITGTIKYKGYWVSHFPMHPQELYGKKNIHGHTHGNAIKNDPRYICTCVETNYGMPIPFKNIEDGTHYNFYNQLLESIKEGKR